MAPVDVSGCGTSVTVLVGSANVGKGISGLRVRVKLVVAVAVVVAVSRGPLVGVVVLVNAMEIPGVGEIVAEFVGESIITGVSVHPHRRRVRIICRNLQRVILCAEDVLKNSGSQVVDLSIFFIQVAHISCRVNL